MNLYADGNLVVMDKQEVADMLEVISSLKANGCADWNIARVLVLDYHYSYVDAKALLREWQRRRPKLA